MPSAGNVCTTDMPAARAEGRALDVAHLRFELRNAVGRRGRARAAIADRQPADLTGRAQIAFEQRRREALRVGDVVEAVAVGVGRQVERGIDVEVEQVLHGRARTRRASAAGRDASPDSGARPPPDRAAPRAPRWNAVSSRGVGPLRAGRRHHPGRQLAHDLLRNLGRVGRARRVEAGQRQPAGLAAVAVAPDAITLHHGPVGLGCRRRREPCRRPGRAWRAGSGRWSRNRRGGRRR